MGDSPPRCKIVIKGGGGAGRHSKSASVQFLSRLQRNASVCLIAYWHTDHTTASRLDQGSHATKERLISEISLRAAMSDQIHFTRVVTAHRRRQPLLPGVHARHAPLRNESRSRKCEDHRHTDTGPPPVVRPGQSGTVSHASTWKLRAVQHRRPFAEVLTYASTVR